MNRVNEFQDALNARKCEVMAQCAGAKDAKLADFLILKRESETDNNLPVMGDTADQIKNKLTLFTLSLGGKING